jgi:hypothetical protein
MPFCEWTNAHDSEIEATFALTCAEPSNENALIKNANKNNFTSFIID